jgi:beta-phosphoglucomutase
MENLKQDNNFEINSDTVLLFDMDGTLIETDFANFLSYKNAIQSVTNKGEIGYNPKERLNRTNLIAIFPNLTKTDYEEIVRKKEENYPKYLSHTKLNKSVADILMKYHATNKTILVTNCRKDRALLTLNYHRLTDKFTNIIFRHESENNTRENKYKNVIITLKLSPQTLLVFENEKQEIEDAQLAGVSINQILSL